MYKLLLKQHFINLLSEKYSNNPNLSELVDDYLNGLDQKVLKIMYDGLRVQMNLEKCYE